MWVTRGTKDLSSISRTWLAACLSFVLLATVFQASALAQSETEKKTTLTWGMMEPIDSLNPFIGVNDNAYLFYGLIYDYLIAVDQDMNPSPNLALSWNIVSNQIPYGSVWQYNLTQNATWHDGEPFTADDVVFTFNLQIGLNYNTMWAYQPYTILIKSVEKIDDYAVRIHFIDIEGNPAPCPFGDRIMVPIIPMHIWSELTPQEAGFEFKNSLPIGTGPFMCTAHTESEFVAGSSIVLERNPSYHGTADYGVQVKYDSLILKFYLEPTAMLTDIETGKIDMGVFTPSQFKNLQDYAASHPKVAIGTSAALSCTGYSIDLEVCMNTGGGDINPLRLDPAVRHAMAYATDKEFIKDNIYKGYAEVGSTIISPVYGPDMYWQPGQDEIYGYDIDKANAVLDAAGYAWNQGHTKRLASSSSPYYPGGELKFNILVEEEMPDHKDIAAFLTTEWAMVGIELATTIVSASQWNTLVYTYAYDLTLSYFSGDPDPNYLLFTQTTYAIDGWSENAYSASEYDENYSKSVGTMDATDRLAYIKNCQKIMYRDCAFMVPVYPYACYAYRMDHFSGWGNMTEHPGRSLSNYWTANPLYFDLVPIPHETASLTPILMGLGVVAAVIAATVGALWWRRGKKEDEVRLP